jgi:hypothetical protein
MGATKWKLARDALIATTFVFFRVCLAFEQGKFDIVGLFAGLRAEKTRAHAAIPSFCSTASERVSIASNGCDVGFVLDPGLQAAGADVPERDYYQLTEQRHSLFIRCALQLHSSHRCSLWQAQSAHPTDHYSARPTRPSSFVRFPPHSGHSHRRKLLFSGLIPPRYMHTPS